jgi:hypothetical protein
MVFLYLNDSSMMEVLRTSIPIVLDANCKNRLPLNKKE